MCFIGWEDLTADEQEQAKNSYRSIMEDVASGGDEYDEEHYRQLTVNDSLLLEEVREKSFIRDSDGYIFVNI